MTIILVDDSQLLRSCLKNLLMLNQNIEIVGEASDGIEAVRIISEKRPDMAIVDVKLPGMNGIEVLRYLKVLHAETKVCILTNYPYRQYREVCLLEGAYKFFDKNCDIQLLIDELNECVKKIGL